MQKLLCVLMFGMMFGQTKLETRVYDISLQLEGGVDYNYQMSELFGYEFDYAIIKVVNASNFYSIYNVTLNFSTPSSAQQGVHLVYDMATRYPDEIVFDKSTAEIANYGYELNIIVSHDINVDLKIAITAEFPQEDTGYIEDGFDYCLHTGANLVSSPCRDEVAIESAIPSDILQNITGIITEGGAASNLGGMWVGSLNGLGGGKGYWVISDIDGCFNYTCSEN